MKVRISKGWTFAVNNVLYKANRDLVLKEVPHPRSGKLVPTICVDGGFARLSAGAAMALDVIANA